MPLEYSKGYSSYRADTKSISNKTKRHRTPKVKELGLSFLYASPCLVLFHISTKYHKNIPNGIQFTEWTGNQYIVNVKYNKGDNTKSKKGRVVILVQARVVILICMTLSCPVLHFYQVPSKYSEGYSSHRVDTKSISNKTIGNNS